MHLGPTQPQVDLHLDGSAFSQGGEAGLYATGRWLLIEAVHCQPSLTGMCATSQEINRLQERLGRKTYEQLAINAQALAT